MLACTSPQGMARNFALDRIDLRIDVPAIMPGDLLRNRTGETSAQIAARVAEARARQAERYGDLIGDSSVTNAHCPTAIIEDVAEADTSAIDLLAEAADKMHFSARGYHRILKVARTLADLDGADHVERIHIAESISYRMSSGPTKIAA